MSGTKLAWLLLIALVLGAAFFLRIHQLDRYPPALSDDEAVNVIDAFHIARSGNFPMYEEDEGRAEPLYRIILATTTFFLGPGIWRMRLVSALLGVLTAAATCRFASEALHDLKPTARRLGALFALVAISVMIGHITLSRSLFRATLQLLFVALSSALMLKALRTQHRVDAGTAGAFAGLTLYTYTAAWVFPPAFGALGLSLLLFHRPAWRRWMPVMLIFTAAALIVASPAIYLALTDSRAVFGRAQALASTSRTLSTTLDQAVGQFLTRGDENPQYNVALAPVVGLLWQPLFFLGLLALLARIRTRSALFLIAMLLLFNVPVVASNEVTHGLRIAAAYVVVAVIIGTAAGVIATLLARRPVPGGAAPVMLVMIALGAIGLDGAHAWRVYRDYWTAPEDWHLWRMFDRQLDHNEWFFHADRRDFAAWLNAQDRPVLIPVDELQYQTTRAWLLERYPDVTTADSSYRLPDDAQLVVPWALQLDGPRVETMAYAVLDGSTITLLPHLTTESHARLVADIERATPLMRSGQLAMMGYTRPIPYALALEFAPVGVELEDNPIASFGDGELDLIRWHGPTTLPAPGESLHFSLIWSPQRRIGHEYTSFLQIQTQDYQRIAGDEHLINRWLYPSSIWQGGDEVPDFYTLTLPPDTQLQPGAYRLALGLYYAHFRAVPAQSFYAPGLETMATVGWLKVPQTAPVDPPESAAKVDARIDEAIALDSVAIRRGDDGVWYAHLYWRGLVDRPRFDATIFVHLFDADGQIVIQDDSRPWNGQYPTFIWDAGELVETVHPLPLERDNLDGLSIRLGMYVFPGPRNLAATLNGEAMENGVILLGLAGEFVTSE